MENIFQRGDRLYTSESDVCRGLILTCKDGLRTERIKIFLMLAYKIGIQRKISKQELYIKFLI